ncbi:hypothetical protein ACOMHN_036745 [Nucella lapillus]
MKFREVGRLSFVINLICFFIAVAVAAVLLLKPLEAVQRGFFCGDENLRYPYHHNTISVPLLVITSFLPAFLLVITLEATYGVLTVRFASAKETNAVAGGGGGGGIGPSSSAVDRSWTEGLRSGLIRGGLLTAYLFYGNCLCFSLTEIFKLSFGTLRPSFISACRPFPDVTSLSNCSAIFLEEVTCQNPDRHLMNDMRKSFLSGHASFVVFNMFFIMLYLQRRLPASTPRLLVSLLQSVATGYAVFVCASRIYDHYHHPPDVVGGAVLGVLTCWVTMFKICPAVIRHPPRAQFDLLPTQGPKQGAPLALTSIQTKE